MFLDTGALLEIFNHPPGDALFERIQQATAGEAVFLSIVQLGELADACRREGKDVAEHVARVRSLAEVVAMDEEIALIGSALKAEARRSPKARDFSLIDGIILATARSKSQRLVTFDPEFEVFSDVIVLHR